MHDNVLLFGDVVVLECNHFAIVRTGGSAQIARSYEIKNADSGERIGTATERVEPFTRFLRGILSARFLPTTVDVREKQDDSMVFSIVRGGWFRTRVEVRDSEGVLVGSIFSQKSSSSDEMRIFDREGNEFAHTSGHWAEFRFKFVNRDSTLVYGEAEKRIDASSGILNESTHPAGTIAWIVHPELSEDPLAKMLLMAAILAIDMIFPSHVLRGAIATNTFGN